MKAQFDDLLQYIQDVRKKHFFVNQQQGEYLADLFCHFDDSKIDDEHPAVLSDIISGHKQNHHITLNILTETQILEAFELLIDGIYKTQIKYRKVEFDFKE